jgi:hypothetical protein
MEIIEIIAMRPANAKYFESAIINDSSFLFRLII